MTDLMKLIKSICEPRSSVPFNPYSGGTFISLITLAPLLTSVINILNSLY